MPIETDVLVIGCGIAGAAAALRLAADRQRQVLVVTRTADAAESNTRYAQGGIVGQGDGDTLEMLARDIMTAGAGLCLPEAVRVLAKEGPKLVQRMLVEETGVAFDCDAGGALLYTLEGGHSVPRVLHVGDATGRAIEQALVARLQTLPNVTLMTGATAVDLITSPHHLRDPLAVYQPVTCHGAYVLEREASTVRRVLAPATVLATGGLAVPGAENFLISEAVRGEGGRLYTPDGQHFMDRYAPRWGDLAPRDVVARAIHREMIEHGYPHVWLDLASHMEPARIRERFPTIHATCLEAGVDISAEPIPVVPAAHYSCGGVLVDGWGRTTIEGLYAVGEVSCTGVHGANRLASTSLLEGLVWGDRAGRDIAGRDDLSLVADDAVPPWEDVGNNALADPVLVYRDRRNIQHVMWLYVGLARSTRRLARALRELNHLWEAIDGFYRATRLSDDLIGLRNLAQAAWVVTRAAWHNRQSRGAHFREDAQPNDFASLHDQEALEEPWV
jgi:L-aspartate oxidase